MICLHNISKRYGRNIIFDKFNYCFQKGQIHLIKGKSGTGKTTLLRMMLGLESFEGSISGMENAKLGVVFQENRLIDSLTIYDNVRLVASEKVDKNRLAKELEEVGLKVDIFQKVSTLSGGMKRRVTIVRGLFEEADIYILDEPFKEIDRENDEKLRAYFEKKVSGKTTFITGHDSVTLTRYKTHVLDLDEVSYESTTTIS